MALEEVDQIEPAPRIYQEDSTSLSSESSESFDERTTLFGPGDRSKVVNYESTEIAVDVEDVASQEEGTLEEQAKPDNVFGILSLLLVGK